MRTAFLLLVLANVAFFAWSRYLFPFEGSVDPLPLARQIEPGKLKVVNPSESPLPAPKAATPAPAPAAASAPPPPVVLSTPAVVPSTPAVVPATPGAAASAVVKCMEWGSFTLTDAPHAEKTLEPLVPANRLAQRKTEESAAWWVFIPPQANRQAALRKAAELKKLGVDDYFIVQDEGPNHWALSLGVFRAEEAAQARLGALRRQGVRSAQIGERETVVPKVWLQVRDVDPALLGKLKEAARTVEGSELRECTP